MKKHLLFPVISLSLLGMFLFGCRPQEPDSRQTDAGQDQSLKERRNASEVGRDKQQGKGNLNGSMDHPGEFKFEPADYRGRWSNEEDNYIVRIVILDRDGTRPALIQAESVSIKFNDLIFSLDPGELDAAGRTSTFSLDNQDLVLAMNLGATVEMVIGEQTYTGKISARRSR